MPFVIVHLMHHVNFSHFAFTRLCSRSVGVRDPRGESLRVWVVHKHEATMILTYFISWTRQAWCIPPKSLSFILKLYFIMSLIVHYVYRNWCEIVTALRFTFQIYTTAASTVHMRMFNWRTGGALIEKRRTVSWERWGEWYGKPAPPRL
jgi:hypothetical protein